MMTRSLILALLLALNMACTSVAADNHEGDADDVDMLALEAEIEAARQRLDEAAQEMARLYERMGMVKVPDAPMAPKPDRAMLGVIVGASRHGVVVEGVTPNGPAAKAGLRSGDVIVGINGETLLPYREHRGKFTKVLRAQSPGDTVQLTVRNDGEERTVDVTLAAARDLDFVASMRALKAPNAPKVFVERYGSESSYTTGDGAHVVIRTVPDAPHAPMAPGAPMHGDALGAIGGLQLAEINEGLSQYFGTDSGVLVLSAKDGLPVTAGDVIIAVDGKAVSNRMAVIAAMASAQDKLSVEVVRNGANLVLDLPALGGGVEDGVEVSVEEVPGGTRIIKRRVIGGNEETEIHVITSDEATEVASGD